MSGRRFIGIEEVVNINDPNILWYPIPGFNGYELSNIGHIRSLKFFNTYPYGTLINPNKDGIYELSNNVNQRIKMSMEEINNLVSKEQSYPRRTLCVDRFSRNPNCTSKSAYKNKVQQNSIQLDKISTFSFWDHVIK